MNTFSHTKLPSLRSTLLALTIGATLSAASAASAMTVTITGLAKPCTYDSSTGVDLGDYRATTFTQKNIRTTSADCPALALYFRPDADGSRDEVVFELGQFDSKTPANLRAYTATIQKAGTTLATINVPYQDYYTRWRWQSAPRPIIRSFDQLIAKGLIPPLRSIPGADTSYGAVTPYKPMETASVAGYMPTTGEREDLGVLPGWASSYIAGRNATGMSNARSQTFANAEASGTFPWHVRDDTGSPLSIDRYRNLGLDSRFGPTVAYPPSCTAAPGGGCYTSIDDAHQPQLTYLPYLLTDDPYYLEELQFAANWHMFNMNSGGGVGLLFNSQVRGYAWTLRQVAFAAAITPDTVPSWLLPRNYFARKLENNRQWLLAMSVNSIDPIVQTFNVPFGLTPPSNLGLWQNDFIVNVVGQMVNMGFTQWKPVFDWSIKSVKPRLNCTSGWPCGNPTTYYVSFMDPATGDVVTTWKDVARIYGLNMSANTHLERTQADGGYLSYMHGAIAYASKFGDAEATNIYHWLQNEWGASMRIRPYLKYDFDPALTSTPDVQPIVAADPQFISPQFSIPSGATTFSIAGIPTPYMNVVASAPGQMVLLNIGKHIARIDFNLKAVPFVSITNTHGGGRVTTNADKVMFAGGEVLDVRTGVLTTGGSGPGPVVPTTPTETPTQPNTELVTITDTSGVVNITDTKDMNILIIGNGSTVVNWWVDGNWSPPATTNADGSYTIRDNHASGQTLTLKNVARLVFNSGKGESRDVSFTVSHPTVPTTPTVPTPTVPTDDWVLRTDKNGLVDITDADYLNIVISGNGSTVVNWWVGGYGSVSTTTNADGFYTVRDNTSGQTLILKNVARLVLNNGKGESRDVSFTVTQPTAPTSGTPQVPQQPTTPVASPTQSTTATQTPSNSGTSQQPVAAPAQSPSVPVAQTITATPTGLQATIAPTKTPRVLLTWRAQEGASHYRIVRNDSSGRSITFTARSPDLFTDKYAVRRGVTYTYKVIPIIKGKEGTPLFSEISVPR